MFFNISLKSKGKWVLIVFGVGVVIFVVSIFSMINVIDKIRNGEIFKGELDLAFNEYYVQADMTVISNKNINTYAVKEWHKEDYTKLEYLDYMKNKVSITLNDNNCTIQNSGNTAKLVVNNMVDNKNITSLNTFGSMYNNHSYNCECERQKHIKDKETIITIILNENCKCSCNCNKIVQDMKIKTLKLILVDGVPKNYIILDKNKKEYISIIYNVFKDKVNIDT